MMSRTERRAYLIGVIGSAVLVLVVAAAVVLPRVYFTARTHDYVGEFANAAGLAVDDQVTVAGVPAGRVTEIELAGDRVRVGFRLDRDQPLGSATTASVKLATILGKRYLSVDPAGPGELAPGEVIPLARTSVPYGLDELADDASRTAGELDIPTLQRMLGAMRTGMPSDPRLVGQALAGVSDATRAVTERGDQLQRLLTGTKEVTSSLLEQQRTLITLLGDADIVLRTLVARRDTVRKLINDVHQLTGQLNQFLRDKGALLGPTLANLRIISDSLAKNDKVLSDTLTQLAPASRYLANATGNGSWGDVSGPVGPIPDNLLCVVSLLKGCVG
jgi:phospholipid/cholesterol/gamma-HCH transport system substrate-binding protein